MIILSKSKDYYDHLASSMGRDGLVVYDRRNCTYIDPNKINGNSNIDRWFRNKVSYFDKKRTKIRRWQTYKVLDLRKYDEETKDLSQAQRRKSDHEDILEGQVYHFVLEIGYHHYIFEVERYLDDEDESKLHMSYGLVEHNRIEKKDKISDAPMALFPITHERYYWLLNEKDRFVVRDTDKGEEIINPILLKTYIPKFITPYDVWCNLYEYISSLKDKEFVDSRTNEQHIESNGFDKKISFRHRKKK